MTKTATIIWSIIGLAIIVGVIVFIPKDVTGPTSIPVSNEVEVTIKAKTIEFGGLLKMISLTQEEQNIVDQINEIYKPYLTPELLDIWKNNPTTALGRSVSSPWPERIDVVEIIKESETTYRVEGNVIEITSDKAVSGVYPITFIYEHRAGNWLISKVTKGAYSELPKRVSVTGVWECLPHRNTTGPQTEECAFGIKEDKTGVHYGVSTELMSAGPVNFKTGDHVKVEGVLVLIEQLSSDLWEKYPIKGIVNATVVVKI